jgi:hypothetical protein
MMLYNIVEHSSVGSDVTADKRAFADTAFFNSK